MMDYKVLSYGESIIGKKRENNEDSFLLLRQYNLFLVADGMGGHQAGEVASSIVKKSIEENYEQLKDIEPYKRLEEIVKISNKRVVERSQEKMHLKGMGSTLTILLLENDSFYIAHVGDSRAYLFREGKLEQITEDHSLIQAQIKAGYLTEQQGKQSRLKNILMRSIGGKKEVLPDIKEGKIQIGDIFLLSTDGFHGELEEEEIVNLILFPDELDKKVKGMLEFANEKDGSDNITIVIVKIETP